MGKLNHTNILSTNAPVHVKERGDVHLYTIGEVIPENIPSHNMEALCRTIINHAEEYYKDPTNVAAFIEWHKQKYGCLPSNIDSLITVLEPPAGNKSGREKKTHK